MAKKVRKGASKKLRNSLGHEAFRRQVRGKTEEEVARALSTANLPIVQSTVHRWLAGETTPDAPRQWRIQAVFPRCKAQLWGQELPVGKGAR